MSLCRFRAVFVPAPRVLCPISGPDRNNGLLLPSFRSSEKFLRIVPQEMLYLRILA